MKKKSQKNPTEMLAEHLSKLSRDCSIDSLELVVTATATKNKELKEMHHMLSQIFKHLSMLYYTQKITVEVLSIAADAFAEFRDKGDIPSLKSDLENIRTNALTTLEVIRKKLSDGNNVVQEREKGGSEIYG